MTGTKRSDRDALDWLADALVEDILDASDQAILAEAGENDDDPRAIAAGARALFERAKSVRAKARLADARAAVAADKRRSTVIASLDPVTARRLLERIVANDDPETARKLTLAARKEGEGLSDDDVRGMLEDLEELGVLAARAGSDGET